MAGKGKKRAQRRSPSGIRVRRARENGYELVFPPGVRERADDMEEIHSMLAAGEIEIAVDELRWLLDGCRELLEAHALLGQIAFRESDLDLARAHFGYAFQLGIDALPRGGLDGPLPHGHPANRAFHEAGKGLVETLLKLGEMKTAQHIAGQLFALDPSDPLGVQEVLRAGGCR